MRFYDDRMVKVLIAGEPGDTVDVLEAEVAGMGHDVAIAMTGQEAYELTLQEKPEAVFLTAQMPVFDGLTVCRMLRDDPDVPTDLPVFLVTDLELDPKAVDRAGLTDLLPSRHEETQVRELLSRHLGKTLWL